ncbi:Cytochrome c heme lyase subunit CcmL [Caenispirillum salinarum AK4]|uniref:Cytochrome c-type biogenesis protein n=1 Tax=Caenispirillum salinarum AK4 TaxID=1238182 RepID=K9H3T7_9PROT|nr:cytochrome c-type biogenesis protein [Caenispirillum salinarum]EKV32217.1 Cytochrome c heme lyase subunit CcmL [Caenispirillum salinarum AK4]
MSMNRLRTLAAAAALSVTVAVALPAGAVLPDEMLDDPKLEERAREVSRNLRCVVCQNESIDASNAELARDMRLIVRDRIAAGDTNEEVLQFMVDRYGDYVLLEPPFKASTYALWFGPAIFLLLAAGAGYAYYRSRTGGVPAETVRPAGLSAEERARLDALLRDDTDTSSKS